MRVLRILEPQTEKALICQLRPLTSSKMALVFRHLLPRVLVVRFEKFLLSFRVDPVLVTPVYIQFTMVLSIWRRCLVLGEAGCGLAVNISLQGFASGLPPP